MSTEVERWVVDRFEGPVAVLVSGGPETVEVARSLLPPDAEEGAVLRVVRDAASGDVRWSDAVVDEEATAGRLTEAEELLKELKKRDPGGDVVL